MSTNLENHGNHGVILTDPGTLTTDRTALSTCTAVFTIQVAKWGQLPNIGSAHPIFKFIGMEHRELSIKGAFAVANCSYAGIQVDTTPPVYELTVGLSDEPIETHPDFVEKIGGTPEKPINGAIFRHVKTKAIATSKEPAPKGASGYVFEAFDIVLNGKLNEFAKIEHYLDAAQMTWRKTWNRRFQATDISSAGKIDQAEGPAPGLGGRRNWLNMGLTSTIRGSAYTLVQEWRASGRRGWNSKIYT